MNDDIQRWSNNPSPVPPNITQWLFELEGCGNNGTVRFLVVDVTGHEICSVLIHRNMACVLAYLDLDYWSTSTKDTSGWNRSRIEHYLRHLREDVVTELTEEEGDHVTLLPSFGSTVLREWAVRVRHIYGHSLTGRNEYHDFCTSNGQSPYNEEFINYGKNHNLSAVLVN
jgi:hypothetical protein